MAFLTQAASAKEPLCRLFARMALSGLPRGGGDGDAIRMGILHIMRENGIREGHRPVSLLPPQSTAGTPNDLQMASTIDNAANQWEPSGGKSVCLADALCVVHRLLACPISICILL